MKRKLQIALTDEAWANVESFTKLANEGFDGGHITWSDTINDMIENGKVDIKQLQIKHTNLRKSLRVLASQEDLDLDAVIKNLTELKSQRAKRRAKSANEELPV